jgi:hypothetical protein
MYERNNKNRGQNYETETKKIKGSMKQKAGSLKK